MKHEENNLKKHAKNDHEAGNTVGDLLTRTFVR